VVCSEHGSERGSEAHDSEGRGGPTVGVAVGQHQQHVCRPSQGGSQHAQFELSQDRMLCAMLLVLLRCDQVTKV